MMKHIDKSMMMNVFGDATPQISIEKWMCASKTVLKHTSTTVWLCFKMVVLTYGCAAVMNYCCISEMTHQNHSAMQSFSQSAINQRNILIIP
jgi:hypothetical protein